MLPIVALIVVDVDDVTTLWVIANVALVAPAGTVTEPATVAAEVLELERVTTEPPLGAGPLKVTVPVIVALLPPTTDDAERTRLLGVGD